MKISKRFFNGVNLALGAFNQVYSSTNHLLVVGLIAAAVGIPAFIYLVCMVSSNAILGVNADQILGVANMPWADRLMPLFAVGVIGVLPIGFFFSGIVKGLAKKKLSFSELVNAGTMPLKSLNFWVLATLLSAFTVEMFSMVDVRDLSSLAYGMFDLRGMSLDMLFCLFAFFVSSLSVVFYLIKKRSVVDSLVVGTKCLINYFLEFLVGLVLWLVITASVYMILGMLFDNVEGVIQTVGISQMLSNAWLVTKPLQGLWVLISAIAWVVFLHDVCRSTK